MKEYEETQAKEKSLLKDSETLDMRDSNSQDKKIGAVFTPLYWVKRIIEKYGLLDAWIQGQTILDPTAGSGFFIEGFIELAREKDFSISEKMIQSLYGVELENEFVQDFFQRILNKYNIVFPKENFINKNFLHYQNNQEFDVIIGNPPRQNFVDLPQWCKDEYKGYFLKYGLIKNMQDMLLGNSRIDIAALIISKAIKDHLKQGGKAYFFLPLSIFLNDGAHQGFRSGMIGNIDFSYNEVRDFNGEDIFGGIATRYGIVSFTRNDKQIFPIKYNQLNKGERIELSAKPLHNNDGPLTIIHEYNQGLLTMKKIILAEGSKPRQGVNTCGANHVFMFDKYEEIDSDYVKLSNKKNSNVILPKKYIKPLMDKKNFKGVENPQKRVLLLHNQDTGKPLEWNAFSSDTILVDYLNLWYDFLNARKGTLINVQISKGYWRGLLGVGPYSFKPYKIAWQAYGEKTFNPKLFYCNQGLHWQGNQSLQAFIGFDTEVEARDALVQLEHPHIEQYLLSMQMEGTCNWAQPGKISKLIEYRPSLIRGKITQTLFDL